LTIDKRPVERWGAFFWSDMRKRRYKHFQPALQKSKYELKKTHSEMDDGSNYQFKPKF